jgi:hypothetical protein
MYNTSGGHKNCIFSIEDASSSGSCRLRDLDGKRTFAPHSVTHIQRDTRSLVSPSILTDEVAGDNQALRWSRPRIGARDKNDRNTSLEIMNGEARTDEMV